MSYIAMTNEEIAVGKPIKQSIMQKIKDNDDYLYSSIEGVGTTLPKNGSFEIDADADGIPDTWTKELYGAGVGAFDELTPAHGKRAYKFTGTGNGGGALTSDYIEVSAVKRYILGFIMWSSVAGVTNRVEIHYYDKNQVPINFIAIMETGSIWTSDTSYTAGSEVAGTDGKIYRCILAHTSTTATRPITGASWATYWAALTDTFTPTSPMLFIRAFKMGDIDPTARYIKIKLIGGPEGSAAGTTYFDNVWLDQMPQWNFRSDFTFAERKRISDAWGDAGAPSYIVLPYNMSIPINIQFIASLRSIGVGRTSWMRFRVGDTYSNEVSNASTTYANYNMIFTYTPSPNSASNSIPIYMQLVATAFGAYGKAYPAPPIIHNIF